MCGPDRTIRDTQDLTCGVGVEDGGERDEKLAGKRKSFEQDRLVVRRHCCSPGLISNPSV